MSDTQATHLDPDAKDDQAESVDQATDGDVQDGADHSAQNVEAKDVEEQDVEEQDEAADDEAADDEESTSAERADHPSADAGAADAGSPDAGAAGSPDAAAAGDDADSSAEPVASGKVDRKARVRQLEREGEVAADFLETLLDIADLDGDIDVDVDGDRAAVAIVDSEEGRVPRRLVGADGKVLEALQELTRLAVQVETGERSRLMLDIAGHRAQRRSTLVALAKQAITEVKESGTKRSLEPMSAFERKVVHDEVAAAGLVSESEGVEPKRHVVILPAGV